MIEDELFLSAATRGLGRRARDSAQAELRSHLHERTTQLMLGGKREQEARTQARAELGSAPVIARSLRRGEQVHPVLSAMALVGLAALLLLPLPTFLREQWLAGAWASTATVAQLSDMGTMNLVAARRQLRPLKISLTRKDGRYVLTHAGLPNAILGEDNRGQCDAPYYSDAQDTPTLPFSQTPRDFYISMPMLLSCMSVAGWPLEVWAGQISLEGQRLPLMDAANFIYGTHKTTLTMLYAPAIAASLSQLPEEVWFTRLDFVSLPAIQPLYSFSPTRTVKLPVPAGTPVLVLFKSWRTITLTPSQKVHHYPVFNSVVVWADQRRQIILPLNFTPPDMVNKPIQLHTSLKTWETAPLTQNAAILIPLTNRITDPIKFDPIKPLN